MIDGAELRTRWSEARGARTRSRDTGPGGTRVSHHSITNTTRAWARVAALTLLATICAGGCDPALRTAGPASAAATLPPDLDQLAAAPAPPVAVPSGTTFFPNVSCGPTDENVFDIFLPASDEPTALVIFIHGGGFTRGDKSMAYVEDNASVIHELLSAGVAYAAFNYRLLREIDDGGVETPLLDNARCLQSLRARAETFNLDRGRVAVYGQSAGAATSLWLGTHDDLAEPESPSPEARESTRVRAVGLLETQASYDVYRWLDQVFAPYQLTLDDAVEAGAETRLRLYYGIESLDELESEAAREKRAAADILGQLDGGDAPLWIQSAIQEEVAPTDSDLLFHHPYHAELVMSEAILHDLETVAYIPELGIGDGSESLVDFLLRHLEPIEAPADELG